MNQLRRLTGVLLCILLVFTSVSALCDGQRVFDDAGLFTASETEALEAAIALFQAKLI